MRILVLEGLDFGAHHGAARKVLDAIERNDFRTADVKKLADGKHYRAKLDYDNRLLLRFAEHQGVKCCFVIEVIEGHRYDRSRFLRGAKLDLEQEARPSTDAPTTFDALPYVHPLRARFRFLDRLLSLDDPQELALSARPPQLMLGSAGTGKTAVSLLRLRAAEGDVAYVTQSRYLAQAARAQYQFVEASVRAGSVRFLSLGDLLDAHEGAVGRAVQYADFEGFAARHRQRFRGLGPRAMFEEFRGVIGADPSGPLGKDAYLGLGVRESMVRREERPDVWELFQTYRTWLDEAQLWDANFVARRLSDARRAEWDFVLVDEVQDFTSAELAFVLRGLRDPAAFVLAGDADQVVHPNFFSWTRVRALLARTVASDLAQNVAVHVLAANYRCGSRIVEVANRLLMLKRARFGSIDRETDVLSTPRSGEVGGVRLHRLSPALVAAIDEASRRSPSACVIVLRDEDREGARKLYRTPLVFAVHEAKGLEYETVILHNLVSSVRTEFLEVCAGVAESDLNPERRYARAKDKDDKSSEAYKFFANALFVGVTRATSQVIMVEEYADHPIFGLLGVAVDADSPKLRAATGSVGEWQREARKLELQGRTVQAASIRASMLRIELVPWPTMSPSRKAELESKGLRAGSVHNKARQQLWDLAVFYDDAPLAHRLRDRLGHAPVHPYTRSLLPAQRRNHATAYGVGAEGDALRLVERHGVEHRSFMNLTPLMHACFSGNVALVQELVDRGADVGARDTYGRTALHWLLHRVASVSPWSPWHLLPKPELLDGAFAAIFRLVSEPTLELLVDGRRISIGQELPEYLVVQLFCAYGRQLTYRSDEPVTRFVCASALAPLLGVVPRSVAAAGEMGQAAVEALLARHEASSVEEAGMRLWTRRRVGSLDTYFMRPEVALRSDGGFVPARDLLGIASVESNLQELSTVTAYHGADGLVHLGTLVHSDDLPPDAYAGLLGRTAAYDHEAYAEDVATAFPLVTPYAPLEDRIAAAARLHDHALYYRETVMSARLRLAGYERPEEGLEPTNARAIRIQTIAVYANPWDESTVADAAAELAQHPLNGSCSTALHHAALMGNPGLVKALLALGASPAARDFYGATPFQAILARFPVEQDHPGTIAALVPLLAPEAERVTIDGKECVLRRGTEAYAFLQLLLACSREVVTTEPTEWDPYLPFGMLTTAIELLSPGLFPWSSDDDAGRTIALRYCEGGPDVALCRLSDDRRSFCLNPALEVWVDDRFVLPSEHFRLRHLHELGSALRRPKEPPEHADPRSTQKS